MSEWWTGLAAVETPGPVGAEEHRVAWRAGELHLLAHPDPEADRALAAFGGEVCPCLDLLTAWEATHVTGSILVVGARRADEDLAAPAAAIGAIAADLARWRGALAGLGSDARAAEDGDVLDRLASLRFAEETAASRRLGGLLLLTLDRRLQHRLQASAAAALAARGEMATLTAAAAARSWPHLRAIGWSGGLEDLSLGEASAVRIDVDRAVLPATWVAAVWGRRLADAVPSHLVVDVTEVTSEGHVTVLAAEPGKAQVEIRVDQWENA